MAYTPSYGFVGGSAAAAPAAVDTHELKFRIDRIAALNPYMADPSHVGALVAMAQSPTDTESLISSASQIYAMQTGNALATQLQGLTPATQRSIVSRLTPGQQAALGQLGYQPPQRDEGSLLGDIAGVVAKPLSVISHGAAAIPGVKPLFGATFNTLTWVGNIPGHLYRSVELMDDNARLAGGIGAVLGVGALLAAPFTGGASLAAYGSLAALGAVGGSALIGATAAAAITNPGDWARAWNASQNGERTFRPDAVARVDKMFGDPRMSGIAQDLAAAGVNPVDLAHELAGRRDVSVNSQVRAIESLALTMAARGTPQFQQAVTSMQNAMQDSTFQEAVQTLNNGKISVGRDFADALGIDQGSSVYNLLSGSTDALFTVALDPTLMLGYGSAMIKAKRYTLPFTLADGKGLLGGSEFTTAFRQFIVDRPNVHRTYVALADAVEHSEAGGKQLMRQYVPQLEPLYGDLVTYKQALADGGRSAKAIFSGDDVIEYLAGQSNLRPILEGIGSVKNARGVQLVAVSAPKMAFREFRGEIRSLVNGMSDIATEAKLNKLAQQNGVDLHERILAEVHDLAKLRGWDFEDLLPTLRSDVINQDGLIVKPWLTQTEIHPNAYAIGRAFGGFPGNVPVAGEVLRKVPMLGRPLSTVGQALTSMTTMAIEGKAIMLTGPKAAKQIRALSEEGRYMGMPSYFRNAWADVILSAQSEGTRYNAINGWLANLMRTTGIDKSVEGRAMLDKYLTKSRQAFGLSDELMVNGHWMDRGIFLGEMADQIIIPNLHEMRKAAVTGGLGKAMGFADLPVIEPFSNKIWKPLVLLRIGFIPRAAGEEMVNFAMRGGIGSLTQNFVGYEVGKVRAYEEALRKVATARASSLAPQLTKEETRLLEQGLYGMLPPFARPLIRTFNRIKWRDPVEQKMIGYGDWLAEKLSHRATEGLGFQGVYGTKEAVTGYTRSTFEMRDLQRLGVLSRPQMATLNLKDYADSILLGNPYSIRRMLAGGVSNNTTEAAREWAKLHSTTVMRELGSTTNGSVDPGFATQKLLPGLEGERSVLVNEAGVRGTLARGDDGHAGAMLDNLQRSLADPAFRPTALEHYSRNAAGTGVREEDLGRAADNLFALGKTGNEPLGHMGSAVEGAQARMISTELLRGPQRFDREQWNAMLTELRRAPGGRTVADTLDFYLKDAESPTIDTVITALDNAVRDLKPGQFVNRAAQDAAAARLEAVRGELQIRAKPVMDYLDDLPEADREFAGQFLYGQMVSGNDGFWALHRGQGAEAPDQWLHRSLSETRQAAITTDSANLLNPRYHDAGVTKSLRPMVRDPQGQFVETQFRKASVMLYEAPRLPKVPFEQLLANANDRQVLLQNRSLVEKLLAADASETSLVADYQLADELARINARLAGVGPEAVSVPRMMRQDRVVTDGRIHGLLTPDADTKTVDGATQLWSYPRQIADKHLVPTPEGAINPAEQMATDRVARFDDLIRRSNKQTVRAKTRIGPNGEELPAVYRFGPEGQLTPVDPNVDIPLGETPQFVDLHGQRVRYDDSRFFTQPLRQSDEPGDTIMWEMLGPAMQDAWADSYHATRIRPKGGAASYSLPGRPTASQDYVPLLRANIMDVKRVPIDDRPAFAIGEIERNRPISTFEQFKRWGFDEVIGPAMDSLIRRPMAFHHFVNRYWNAKRALAWTVDPELLGKMGDIVNTYSDLVHSADLNPETLANAARTIQVFHGERIAAKRTDEEALAWLRGHSEGEMADLLTRTITTSAHEDTAAAHAANQVARKLEGVDYRTLQATMATGRDPLAALDVIEASLPNGALASRAALNTPAAKQAIAADPFLSHIDANQEWDTVLAAYSNVGHQRRTAGELASQAAIADAMPFIDSHHFKTQFADWIGGYAPFWYAEENFMKRWARSLADAGPSVIRHAQLTYMGIKQAGIVRTDQSGRDWFVYPGSGLMAEGLSMIPGLSGLQNAGILFETPTDQMLPGLNNRFGAPTFNPVVSIPMDIVTSIFPELQQVDRAILGDFSAGQGVLNQITPAWARNLSSAVFGDEKSNTRMASALNTAIAFSLAHDQGPKDESPLEHQRWMDRMTNQARIIVIAQSIGGFMVPGAPSLLLAGKSANVAGIGVDNPADMISAEYLSLVRSLGVEEGTAEFLKMNKNATIDDITNPIALTVPRNVSTSGAPIPSTEDSLKFMQDNAGYFDEFPNAAPWLIPQNYDKNVERSQYAFDQQMIDGMRHQRTADEFYAAIKFKQGAQEYFTTRDAYLTAIDTAMAADNKTAADSLRTEMDWKLNIYRVAHPLFASELASSDGRTRRAKVIGEMRTVVDDPQAPPTPQFGALRTAMHLFDNYQTRLSVLGNDASMQSRREADYLRSWYRTFMEQFVRDNPTVSSFWGSVLKPEAGVS